MNMICELRATYNDLLALQDQTDTIPLARALDAVGLALEAVEGPTNEDPSGQRREPMAPSLLDDEPPFRDDGKALILRARNYLAHNAAESGADVLIAELIEEVERVVLKPRIRIAAPYVRITWTQYALNYMDLPKEKSGTLR